MTDDCETIGDSDHCIVHNRNIHECMIKAPPMQGDEIDDDGYADAHGHSTTTMPLKVFREALTAAEARGYERGLKDGLAKAKEK